MIYVGYVGLYEGHKHTWDEADFSLKEPIHVLPQITQAVSGGIRIWNKIVTFWSPVVVFVGLLLLFSSVEPLTWKNSVLKYNLTVKEDAEEKIQSL